MTNPYLVGETVYLRPFEPEDAEIAAAWMNSREVTRTVSRSRPWSIEQEREFLRNAISERAMTLGIALKETDELIGGSGLMDINHLHRRAEFGTMIGLPEHWGKGIGTEVTRLMCTFGFEDLNLNRIYLRVAAANEGGITAYERAGFRREGVLRQASFRSGEPSDEYLMAILREEWSERR